MRQLIGRASLAVLIPSFCLFASDIDRVRELNQQILQDMSGKSVRRSAASADALRERAALLNDLIARDPVSARGLLLSPQTLQDLRTRQASDGKLLERTFAYTGPVESTVVDQPREKRSLHSYLFESGGEMLTAYGGPALSLHCGDEARLEGYRLGNVMLVTAAAVERAAEPAAECRTDGVQRLAVILANFPGAPTPELTKARIGELIFGTAGRTVSNFYKEASYGALNLTGDVFGWYMLDREYKCGEYAQLRVAALKAADTDVDFTRYSRVVVVYPGSDACETLGQGTIGCQTLVSPSERTQASYASVRFTQADDLLTTVIHELGHNFGVGHARTMRFPGTAIGPDRGLATFEEYGDLFSVMGSGEAHFSAAQKVTLGWLRQTTDYTNIQTSGVFDLAPLQSPGAGVKALRVKRNAGDDVLWIEYRQPVGAFDSSDNPDLRAMFEGATIRAQSTAEELYSDLLDFTPASIDETRLLAFPGYFTDPVLRPGQVWRDPFSDLTLEVLSMTPQQLRVSVRYDTPCTTVSGITDGALISPEGRPIAISVSGTPECAWSASPSRSWLDVPGGLNRKGNANVTLEAQRNSTALSRRASLTIERKTFGVTQTGIPAPPAVSVFGPKTGSFPSLQWISTDAIVSDPNGVDDLKEFLILINDSQTEQNGCVARYDFAARSLSLKVPETGAYSLDTLQNGEWRFVSNSRCGAGYASVTAISDTEFEVWMDFAFLRTVTRPQEIYTMAVDRSASTGWVRQGSFTFDTACRVIPRPFRRDVPASAGVYLFEVVPTSEPCAWQVTTASPWIKIQNPSGKEYDLVLYSVDANPGPGARTGTLTVGEYTLQINQAPPGTIRSSDFVVSPVETLVSSGAGIVTLSVQTQSDAAWQVNTTTPWLTVLEKTSQSVTLVHDANSSSSERRGTVTIAGNTVVVRQMAGDPLRPAIADGGVVNAASFLTGISPGGWFTVRGVNLAPGTRTWTASDFNGDRLPTSLDGVKVLVNGKPAYIYYISPTQINALAPEDTAVGLVPIEIDNNGRRSLFEVTLLRTRAPGLFMMPAPVSRLAAITLPDGTLIAPPDTFPNTATRGAKAGDAISLYATGLGATNPAYPEGLLLQQPLPITAPVVTLGGRLAKVLYSGLISPGLYQINIEVPEIPTGEHEVVLSAQGTRTQQKAILFVGP